MSYDQEIVSGVVGSHTDLQRLLQALETRGFGEREVSVVMSRRTHNYFLNETHGMQRGAGIGATAGSLLGLLLGAMVAAPGGLLIAGPFLGLLTGGLLGATTGGIIGAIREAGVDEAEAGRYLDLVNEAGNVLVIVHVPRGKHVSEVRQIFESFHLRHIHVTG